MFVSMYINVWCLGWLCMYLCVLARKCVELLLPIFFQHAMMDICYMREYDWELINQTKRIAWMLPLYNPCRSKREGCPTINYFHMAFTSSQRHIQLHNIKFLHNPRGSSREMWESFTTNFLIYQETFSSLFSFSLLPLRYFFFLISVCISNTCGRYSYYGVRASKGELLSQWANEQTYELKKIYELNLTFNTLKIHFSSTMRIRIWAMASIR